MTSNDLLNSWVMYSTLHPVGNGEAPVNSGPVKSKGVSTCAPAISANYILYKACYKDSTLEYYIVVALSCCRSVPILLSKKYHSNVNTMEL